MAPSTGAAALELLPSRTPEELLRTLCNFGIDSPDSSIAPFATRHPPPHSGGHRVAAPASRSGSAAPPCYRHGTASGRLVDRTPLPRESTDRSSPEFALRVVVRARERGA